MYIHKKLPSNAVWVEKSTRFITLEKKQTLIRVCDLNDPIINKINQCQSPNELLTIIKTNSNKFQIPPVGLIGPKEASKKQYELAEQFGYEIASLGLTVICGGRNGAMEAVCKGAYHAGGKSIALLPGDSCLEANPYVTIPVVTNMGPTRNSLIAKTAFVLVAVGGGYGTLTEMAYGLHYDKKVLAINDAPSVEGAIYHDDLKTIIEDVIKILMGE